MRKIILTCFTIWSLFITPALAQLDTSFTDPEIQIELQPTNPQPGDLVTATLNDYSGGFYGAAITWMIDGEEIVDGTNRREITFIAGKNVVSQKIEIILTLPNGIKSTIENVFTPEYLDIIVEPQTRVPDFYQGRSLPSLESQVNATALIDGGNYDPNNLVYTWRINRKVIEGGPLRGRNQVSFIMPMGDTAILSVSATKGDGTVVASRAILIPSVSPKLRFYETSPLFGINQKAIGDNYTFIGNSVTVRAEPYNLDTRIYNNPDLKEWKINNISSGQTGINPYEVTLQRTGTNGSTELQFHVRDLQQVLQGARDSVRINF